MAAERAVGVVTVYECEESIPTGIAAKLCQAAAAAGVPCDGGARLGPGDVLAWLDREGWSWQVDHTPGGPWTCLLGRDTWPGLVYRRLDFLGGERESLGEAVVAASYYALACGAVARGRVRWAGAFSGGLPDSGFGLERSGLGSALLGVDEVRALRRAFVLAGLKWPFGQEVSVEAVLWWLRECGWEVSVDRSEGVGVKLRRTVGVAGEEVMLEECCSGVRGSEGEPSLEEAVTEAALWAFAVAQWELKGFRLTRGASYGRLGSDSAIALLALMSRAGEPWPFSLSPGMFELTGWLEQRGWRWSLCRNNLPEHVLDDPEWRRHQWVLILSGHGHHGLAYRGETLADLFLRALRDLLEGGGEGVELPDLDNPPDDEELLDTPPLDDAQVMLVIRAADRRFEPPPWMVGYVQEREDGQ
ncbi:MAG: hypothetical protein ACOY3F_07990 [Bacillota bacterium]